MLRVFDAERDMIRCCWWGGAMLSSWISPVEREVWSLGLCLSERDWGLDSLPSCAGAERCVGRGILAWW